MNSEHQAFIDVINAMGKLVVFSIIIERGLAFIYEHYWFVKLTTITDPNDDPTKIIKKSKFPALKANLALIVAIGLCFIYNFDILAVIFADKQHDIIGMLITGVVVAGGSSGAIAIFQATLGISKDSRDATIKAKQAETEAESAEAKAKQAKAEAESAEAKAKQVKAEAEVAEAKAKQVKAEAEAAEAEAKKK